MKISTRFRRILLLALALGSVLVMRRAHAQLQTCLPGGTPPSTPPRPTQLIINIPAVDGGSFTLADGGTFACTGYALVPGGATPQMYGSTPVKCNAAIAMALQMGANDNAWNDGGVP